MKIAIIPARGGSKRIPRKNIKLFCGKPIIEWSIAVAKNSKLFDRIIVSTDDLEIAEIALKCGAEIPFMRPAKLSDDQAGTTEVVAHATAWAIEEGLKLSGVCCIYPAAPFIQASDIVEGWNTLNSGNWAYTFPATDYASPIFRSFKDGNGGVEMFFPDHYLTRSQDLPVALHDAGQFYWGRPDAWLQNKRIFEVYSKPIIIPNWRVQDIDNLEDWKRAEIMNKYINNDKYE